MIFCASRRTFAPAEPKEMSFGGGSWALSRTSRFWNALLTVLGSAPALSSTLEKRPS